MRAIGIILIVLGSLTSIFELIDIIKGITTNPTVIIITLVLVIIGIGLLLISNHKMAKSYKNGKSYNDIRPEKVVGITFGILMVLGALGSVLYRITVGPQKITTVIQQMNKRCPIHIEGIGTISRVDLEDSLVVMHCLYDSDNDFSIIAKENPEKATRMTMLSILLNTEGSHGQSQIIDKIIDNNYGLKLDMLFISPRELDMTKKEVVATCSELKELRQIVSNNPSQAFKEIVEWQIEMNKSDLPVEIDETLTLIDLSYKDNSILYKYEIEDGTPLSDFQDSREMRIEIIKSLCEDPVARVDVQKWIVANVGLIHRYINKVHNDSIDQVFTVSEIKEAYDLSL